MTMIGFSLLISSPIWRPAASQISTLAFQPTVPTLSGEAFVKQNDQTQENEESNGSILNIITEILSMKAVFIEQYGKLDQLRFADIPVSEPAAGEILIRVEASAINPVDWKIMQGMLQGVLEFTFPLILGWDVAGVVEKVGADVRQFSVGDEVYTRPDLGRNGGHAEYIAVKADEVALKPKPLSFTEAAALPLAGITAWEAVIEQGRIGAGQRILIHAGSGGVGSLAIQLAKSRGAEVYTTTSASNADWVGELGADHVIDYQRQDFVELARGMDVVFDTMGGEIQERSWQTLRSDGLLVSIVEPPDANVAREAGVRSAFVFIQPDATILRELASLVEAGRLRPVIDRVFPLSQAGDAYAVSMSGRARGKLVFERS